ncbi:MAG: tetratricopeptide repeat protein [Spirochaetes bacterium]|nr:tetratricopeptide repeat protein [Spirochaetota bacterium]
MNRFIRPTHTRSAMRACIILLLLIMLPRGAHSDALAGKTIAHDFLELEKEFGAGKTHTAALDALLARAKSRLRAKATSDSGEAVAALTSVGAFLRDEGFRTRNNYLLSKGIEWKGIDCDNYSALYVAIGEFLGIPIVPVYAPNHSFVRYGFTDGTYLNWEPLEMKALPDSFYVRKLGIAKESVEKGVYLKSLNRREFLGVQYNSLGSQLMARRKYGDAVPYFTMALSLHPAFAAAFHNRGTALYALKRTDEALRDLTKAEELDPARAVTHNTLGDIYHDRKEYDRAARHYRAAIVHDPTMYAPYYNWGIIMKTLGKDEIAKKLLDKAAEIKKQYPGR